MAHQTNVHRFTRSIRRGRPVDIVKDPNCGKKMNHGEVKHMAFRHGKSLYFCSKSCETEFLRRRKPA